MSDRTIIVGGGAIGLSVAWELARRGDQVTLLERESRVGKGTSWGAAGILPPANLATATDPMDQLRGLSHHLFPRWADELMSITKIDPGFRPCGGWYLADTSGERASMIGMTDYWNSLGIPCESVTPQQVSVREPALQLGGNGKIAAWWVPGECQVRCSDYLLALRQACLVAGVDVIEDAVVDDLRWNSRSAGAHLPDRWLDADRVVVCGGAWTGSIAATLRLQRSIVPIRGQIVTFKTTKPLLSSIVNVGHRYLLCRDDGHTIVGSCEEEVGFQLGTTDAMLSSLQQFAVELVPALGREPILDCWSGLRPMTFDGFPMIGRLPQAENVFVAAGHFRSGIHLSPATAVTLADLMMGDTSQVNLAPFRVGKQQSAIPDQATFVHD